MGIKQVIKKYKKLDSKAEALKQKVRETIDELNTLSPYPVGSVVEVVGPVHKGKKMEVFRSEFIGADVDNKDLLCWTLKGYVLKKDGSKTSHIAESWAGYET